MDNFQIFEDIPHSEMILIPSGSCTIGSDNNRSSEKPAHEITIPKSFWMGKFPVTQALWKRVMHGENPSRFRGDDRPVERVSWEDAQDFIEQLHQQTDKQYSLPSEAQWEYAAHGGEKYTYGGSNDLEEVGWYDDNSGLMTMPVGLKNPNGFGLHDMNGNVWEWCEDDWHSSYEIPTRPDDGSAWVDNPRASFRVLRGGSYFDLAEYCRSSIRYINSPDGRNYFIGFRLVLFQSVG